MQWVAWPLHFALPRAGNNIAARIAMMAITTSSSISVKARRVLDSDFISVNDYDSLLPEPEPVKLLGAGDGIGHGVLPIDDDGIRRNRTPSRRGKVSRRFQLKARGVGGPRQNHVQIN